MFTDPQLALSPLSGLIVIDEIQRVPELFPLIRHLVDTRKGQRCLILGSVSRDLIRQSSESLAGRIAYHELQGFRLGDVGAEVWRNLRVRGGVPLSIIFFTTGARCASDGYEKAGRCLVRGWRPALAD